ncbi:MAG: hypothetical protein Q9199_001111 [Rusavskia elegans]
MREVYFIAMFRPVMAPSLQPNTATLGIHSLRESTAAPNAKFPKHIACVGAAFKLHPEQQEGFTDFVAAGSPDNYAWNVVRSEADELMFLHARKSGANVYDNTKVTDIEFVPLENEENKTPSDDCKDPGYRRLVSATYTRNSDPAPGTIRFNYLVDASGRAGLLSNKYQKTRQWNRGLNNIAYWGYWRGNKKYAPGTARENSPYIEALHDEAPLRMTSTSLPYTSLPICLSYSTNGNGGELISEIKSASDYSYSASSYASPYVRIVGDAGCFIDPFFSSGVHLALVGALSAATTICAAIRNDCQEPVAAKWHSTKVADSYARFLLVVLSAYKQIRSQNEPILSDLGDNNLDHAFARFRPGTADVANGVSQSELSETIPFCANAWDSVKPEQRATILQKIQRTVEHYTGGTNLPSDKTPDAGAILEKVKRNLSEEEVRVMNYIRARQLMRTEDTMHMEHFSTDVIDGLAPVVERGGLTLREATPLVDFTGGIDTRQSVG